MTIVTDREQIAFGSAEDAVKWCLETQQALLKEEWPSEIYEGEDSAVELIDGVEIYRGLRVRMGVHTGEPSAQRDPVTGRMDYFGPMVNRSARVEGTAHGGQIVISGDVYQQVKDALESGAIEPAEIQEMGSHRLKELQSDTELFQLLPVSLTKRRFPVYGGAKPEEIEESESARGLEAEMDQLAKENGDLKSKMEKLESDAQEAIEKADELGKWLEDIAKDLPESLAKDLMRATTEIKNLNKALALITASLADARDASGANRAEIDELQRQLIEAREKVAGLENEVEEKQMAIDEITRKKRTFAQSLSRKIKPLKGRTKKTSAEAVVPPEPEEDVTSKRSSRVFTKGKGLLNWKPRTSKETDTDITEEFLQDSAGHNNQTKSRKNGKKDTIPKEKEVAGADEASQDDPSTPDESA